MDPWAIRAQGLSHVRSWSLASVLVHKKWQEKAGTAKGSLSIECEEQKRSSVVDADLG